ncbi:MAG: hypothetical protein JNK27_06170 [Chitinophagaceae bacterium]|nr:hypothetical protein [Chitinophagaceae bacterium]
MNKPGNTRISAFFFFLVIVCLGVKTAHAAPAIHKTARETISEELLGLPNGELEVLSFPVASGWQVVVQKNPGQQDFVLSISTLQYHLSSTSSYNKGFLYLIRDYLLHIYPTHNFW